MLSMRRANSANCNQRRLQPYAAKRSWTVKLSGELYACFTPAASSLANNFPLSFSAYTSVHPPMYSPLTKICGTVPLPVMVFKAFWMSAPSSASTFQAFLVFSSLQVRVFGFSYVFESSFLLMSPFSLLLEDFLPLQVLSLCNSSLAFDVPLRLNTFQAVLCCLVTPKIIYFYDMK